MTTADAASPVAAPLPNATTFTTFANITTATASTTTVIATTVNVTTTTTTSVTAKY